MDKANTITKVIINPDILGTVLFIINPKTNKLINCDNPTTM